MKSISIAVLFSVLLLCLPISSWQFANTIELHGIQWEKDTLDILVVGDNPHYTNLAIDAIGNYMYAVVSTTGEYDEWHYQVKVMNSTEYQDLSWYLRWDIVFWISDNYQAAGSTGNLGVTNFLKIDGSGVPDNHKEEFSRADITITTMYNSTNYIPDFMFFDMVAHEYGHALGLGHPQDENYERPTDLMSGAQVWNVTYSNTLEIDIGGLVFYKQFTDETQITYIMWRHVGYMKPSPLNISALVQIYDTDGWNYRQHNDNIPQSYGQTYIGE